MILRFHGKVYMYSKHSCEVRYVENTFMSYKQKLQNSFEIKRWRILHDFDDFLLLGKYIHKKKENCTLCIFLKKTDWIFIGSVLRLESAFSSFFGIFFKLFFFSWGFNAAAAPLPSKVPYKRQLCCARKSFHSIFRLNLGFALDLFYDCPWGRD